MLMNRIGVLILSIFAFSGALISTELRAQDDPSLKKKADQLVLSRQFVPALETYAKILDQESSFASCHYNMAICYHELGQFDKAYDSLVQFVKLHRSDGEAYFNMGILQVYLGNDQNARILLRKARTLSLKKDLRQRIENALTHLVSNPNPFPQDSLQDVQEYLTSHF